MKVFNKEEIDEKLTGLKGWTHTPQGIQKRYEADGFMAGILLVNRVA